MKTYSLLLLAALAGISSCKEDNKACLSIEKANDLAIREQQLNDREAAVSLREQNLQHYNDGGDNISAASGSPAPVRILSSDQMSRRSSYAGNVQPKRNYVPAMANLTAGQYPEGTDRLLLQRDVEHLSPWGAQVLLNEIYARHGMIFPQGALRDHFNGESWYKGKSKNVDKKLTAVERQNIRFMQQVIASMKAY